MDVQMPDDGWTRSNPDHPELAKEDARTIPIIALTANAFRNDMENALKSGMNDYLSKPIDPDKLIRMIARSLDKKEVIH